MKWLKTFSWCQHCIIVTTFNTLLHVFIRLCIPSVNPVWTIWCWNSSYCCNSFQAFEDVNTQLPPVNRLIKIKCGEELLEISVCVCVCVQAGQCPSPCPPEPPWFPPLPPWRRALRCPPAPQPGTTARRRHAGKQPLLLECRKKKWRGCCSMNHTNPSMWNTSVESGEGKK